MERRPPLVVDLHGGLGNLLFQYAAGWTVARELDRPLLFSERSEGRLATLRSFLGVDLPAAPWMDDLLAGGRPRDSPPVLRYLAWLLRRLRPWTTLVDNFSPRPPVDELRRVRRLSGHHQHPSYFDPALDHVLERLAVTLGADRGDGDGVLAVHLRRGDYLPLGWDLPLAYYRAALDHVGATTRAVVVADDDLARRGFESHLRDEGRDVVGRGDGDPPPSAREDFRRLASAQHLVLANSTFSWWAGALGDRLWRGEPRRVCYPAGWLTGDEPDVLLRPGWIPVRSRRGG